MVAEIVNLQFGSIAKKFEYYEEILDNNKYNELNETLESIDDMLKHMNVVIDEIPLVKSEIPAAADIPPVTLLAIKPATPPAI